METGHIKIAVVHDWFNQIGGAEKVVKEILKCYPQADVFCLFDFLNAENRKEYLFNKKTKTSFIQHIPFAKTRYRNLFPLFSRAIESLDLSAYDVIISSSSCVAKGVKKKHNQLHISYCHSPARYVWDLKEEYLKTAGNKPAKKALNFFFEKLRQWDLETSNRVDFFIANSNFVSNRIKNFYNRESTVIYPPVNIDMKETTAKKKVSFLSISRLVTYKNVDIIIEAFRKMPDLKLEIAGEGILKNKLMKNLPSNITYLGYVDEATKKEKISNAKAFIAAATEDFGITIVEAQSYCTPIIVPYVGGYKETVNQNTGMFYYKKTPEALVEAVEKFCTENRTFKKEDFLENIQPFCEKRFHNEIKSFIDDKIRNFLQNR